VPGGATGEWSFLFGATALGVTAFRRRGRTHMARHRPPTDDRGSGGRS
jgi:hypothetical protein